MTGRNAYFYSSKSNGTFSKNESMFYILSTDFSEFNYFLNSECTPKFPITLYSKFRQSLQFNFSASLISLMIIFSTVGDFDSKFFNIRSANKDFSDLNLSNISSRVFVPKHLEIRAVSIYNVASINRVIAFASSTTFRYLF